MSIQLKKNMTILFQGDSVTDAGRNDPSFAPMGNGYASMISSRISAMHPDLNLKFVNRGISGNRTADLVARWDTDCLALKPDVLSVLVGINNTWRRYDSNDPTPLDRFYGEYREILLRVKKDCDPILVICEPFLVPSGNHLKAWREDLDPKIQAVRELAREFKATFVPYDGLFAAASTQKNPAYWAEDGVHPTAAGHAFMADEWISRVLGKAA